MRGNGIAVIVGVVVLALGGILWWKYNGVTPPPNNQPSDQNQTDPTANWKIYTKNGWSLEYPDNWTLKDDSYIRDGQTFLLFHITSPDRFDLPGYQGTGVHYLIQITISPTNKVETVADFAKARAVGDQSAWNTNLSKEITQSTEEHKVAQQIISSLKFNATTPVDWKTYRNEQYGFEFKYPSDWIKEGESIYSPDAPKEVYGVTDKVFVATYTKTSQESISEWIAENSAYLIISDKGPIYIGSVPAHQYLESGIVPYISTYIENIVERTTLINLQIPESSNYLNEYNQILSSTRFFEPNPSRDWATYRSGQYGIEFRYPNRWEIYEKDEGGAHVVILDDRRHGQEPRESINIRPFVGTADDYIKSLRPGYVVEQTPISLAGLQAVKIKTEPGPMSSPEDYGIIVKQGTFIYVVYTSGGMEEVGILSTFKFTN